MRTDQVLLWMALAMGILTVVMYLGVWCAQILIGAPA